MRRRIQTVFLAAEKMIKNLRGQCPHCGGGFEFPATAVGETAPCPHCGQPTELFLAAATSEPSPARRSLTYAALAALILALGAATMLLLLKRAERLAHRHPASRPDTAHSAAPTQPGR
jgi:uncharacterized paraquat-inducible protein A